MRTCKVCKVRYDSKRIGQKVCSPECAIHYARQERDKAKKAQNKERREALKTPAELAKEAQAAFNKYIRVRDEKDGCISCGTRTAGQYHAGHYRTTKAAPQLRFNTYNVFKQCAQCNNWVSGNITEYRINLIKRIGLERVEWLENYNTQPHWDKDYLRRMKKVFSARARHLEKVRQKKAQRITGLQDGEY